MRAVNPARGHGRDAPSAGPAASAPPPCTQACTFPTSPRFGNLPIVGASASQFPLRMASSRPLTAPMLRHFLDAMERHWRQRVRAPQSRCIDTVVLPTGHRRNDLCHPPGFVSRTCGKPGGSENPHPRAGCCRGDGLSLLAAHMANFNDHFGTCQFIKNHVDSCRIALIKIGIPFVQQDVFDILD